MVPLAQLADDLPLEIVSQSDNNPVPHVLTRTLAPYLQWSACLEEPGSGRNPPSRRGYLDPHEIADLAFFQDRTASENEEEEIEAKEETSEEEEAKEEADEEETPEEGSYSEHSEGEQSEEEEEEEQGDEEEEDQEELEESEWEGFEEKVRAQAQAEKREEIGAEKRQLEFASAASHARLCLDGPGGAGGPTAAGLKMTGIRVAAYCFAAAFCGYMVGKSLPDLFRKRLRIDFRVSHNVNDSIDLRSDSQNLLPIHHYETSTTATFTSTITTKTVTTTSGNGKSKLAAVPAEVEGGGGGGGGGGLNRQELEGAVKNAKLGREMNPAVPDDARSVTTLERSARGGCEHFSCSPIIASGPSSDSPSAKNEMFGAGNRAGSESRSVWKGSGSPAIRKQRRDKLLLSRRSLRVINVSYLRHLKQKISEAQMSYDLLRDQLEETQEALEVQSDAYLEMQSICKQRTDDLVECQQRLAKQDVEIFLLKSNQKLLKLKEQCLWAEESPCMFDIAYPSYIPPAVVIDFGEEREVHPVPSSTEDTFTSQSWQERFKPSSSVGSS
ncbi:hypothetical protein CBR_g37182 [Chara braunii]|uniref:Uncharacterized protein n=1 Tax=Chara braunii TaxID=69332 RepID=A0A388LMB5_CHABU|nr:hypothetical protein CBR_g37182 [Chara braunii]|eukprot:GBG83470.1 hypothetical protein CBR_g37182 [Chara braunii]